MSDVIANGGYLQKEVKGLFSAKWQKRFFYLDYNGGALVHYKNDKKAPTERKEKLKLCDLHGVDRVDNTITVTGNNKEVLVLRAENSEAADPWFAALNKDFEEAKRAREERLMREAAAKAEREANARGEKRYNALDEEHKRKQKEMENANAAKLAEQQRLLDEQRKAREAKETELAKLEETQRLEKERAEAAKAEQARLKAEQAKAARLEAEATKKAEREVEDQFKREEEERLAIKQQQKEEAEAKAKRDAEAKAKAEAAEKDRLEQERLMKLDRNARFSGLNSIYHEAPTTWVDYSKITKNNDLLLRKSIEAKKQANNWLNEQSQRRKTQTAAP
jgi:hypothetical protein